MSIRNMEEDKMREINRKVEAERTKKEFIEALDEFNRAFDELDYYAGHIYIDDRLWDGDDNYPFDKSFDEMPSYIREWVDSVKRRVSNSSIQNTYCSEVYASEIIPWWRDDDNLFMVEFKGEQLYSWYLNEFLDPGRSENSSFTPEAFNKFMSEESDADSLIGAYEYCAEANGIVKVTK